LARDAQLRERGADVLEHRDVWVAVIRELVGAACAILRRAGGRIAAGVHLRRIGLGCSLPWRCRIASSAASRFLQEQPVSLAGAFTTCSARRKPEVSGAKPSQTMSAGSWSTRSKRPGWNFLSNRSGLINLAQDRPDRESGLPRPHQSRPCTLAASRGQAHIPGSRSGSDRTGWKRRSNKAARLREAPKGGAVQCPSYASVGNLNA
jgi:hypothetical protein